MIKKISAIVLVFILAFGLTACDSGSAASVSSDAASSVVTSEEEISAEIPEVPLTKGEAIVDVGDFTLTVPEGWLGAGDYDVDENGEYFIEPYYYVVIKGGESADDQWTKPSVSIYYSSTSDAQAMYDNNISPTNENTELDLTVGGKKCPACHSVSDYSEEGEDPVRMEYDNVFIPVSDSSCIRLTMLTFSTVDGDTGISVSDKDVIAIMESLKAK